jgi:hypothetical protein
MTERCEWCNRPISGPGYRLRICESCRRNSIPGLVAFRESLPPQTGPVGPIVPRIASGERYCNKKEREKRK